MTSARITKEGDATFRIHYAESQGRIHTSLPPFILAFYHQARNAIDVAVASPLYVCRTITAEVGTRRITMEGNDTEGAVWIPSREIPGERGLRRMSQRNHRSLRYLEMAAIISKIRHQFLKDILCTRVRIPIVIKSRSHPYHGNAQFLHLCLKTRVLIDSLLCHVLLREHHCLYLLAALWNPEISHRCLACFIGNISSQFHRPQKHSTASHTYGMGYRD